MQSSRETEAGYALILARALLADEHYAMRDELAEVRRRLGLSADAPSSELLARIESLSAKADGFEQYVSAKRSGDSADELARQSVKVSELEARIAVLREDLESARAEVRRTREQREIAYRAARHAAACLRGVASGGWTVDTVKRLLSEIAEKWPWMLTKD